MKTARGTANLRPAPTKRKGKLHDSTQHGTAHSTQAESDVHTEVAVAVAIPETAIQTYSESAAPGTKGTKRASPCMNQSSSHDSDGDEWELREFQDHSTHCPAFSLDYVPAYATQYSVPQLAQAVRPLLPLNLSRPGPADVRDHVRRFIGRKLGNSHPLFGKARQCLIVN